jgi:hypothetical protein
MYSRFSFVKRFPYLNADIHGALIFGAKKSNVAHARDRGKEKSRLEHPKMKSRTKLERI